MWSKRTALRDRQTAPHPKGANQADGRLVWLTDSFPSTGTRNFLPGSANQKVASAAHLPAPKNNKPLL
jgi:hypothetical protein